MCFNLKFGKRLYKFFDIVLIKVDKNKAKNIFINSQKLDVKNPFGNGPEAVRKAILHLGYVQIDTISVIERCHHHILFSRIPTYKKKDLHRAQSVEKSVFEYWTHALAYVAVADFRYFVNHMKSVNTSEGSWFGSVTPEDYRKVKRLMKNGPVSIRDITDDVLVEKEHEWASAKPSKKALQLGFIKGEFVIAERKGMLKQYDLTSRHFGWDQTPKAASQKEYIDYVLERALRSQGIVSLDSVCHLYPKQKSEVKKVIDRLVKKNELVEVQLSGESVMHWMKPELAETEIEPSQRTHILSPFDPLIIQRKKLKTFFDYEHLFEAYIPKAKRKFGYFSLPVLSENNIVALLDLKTDRQENQLLVQAWHWIGKNKSANNKIKIEDELDRFKKFQLAK